MPIDGLIERGIVQGSYIDCASVGAEVRLQIQDARAIADKRKSPIEPHHKLIVLSQDCDISNPNDRYVELATAKVIPRSKTDERVQRTRNPRKLHVFVKNECWEIRTDLIAIVPKATLLSVDGLQATGMLEDDYREILIQWRVSRYARSPLPDAFNRAFFDGYVHQNATGFSEFLTNNRNRILALFAFVRPLDDEHSENYRVSLTMVLRAECTSKDVTELLPEFRGHINHINQQANCLTMIQADGESGFHSEATNLELVCLPEDFSLRDRMGMPELNMDFLCWNEVGPEDLDPA